MNLVTGGAAVVMAVVVGAGGYVLGMKGVGPPAQEERVTLAAESYSSGDDAGRELICDLMTQEHSDDDSKAALLRNHGDYLTLVSDALSNGDDLGLDPSDASSRAGDLGQMADELESWKLPDECNS